MQEETKESDYRRFELSFLDNLLSTVVPLAANLAFLVYALTKGGFMVGIPIFMVFASGYTIGLRAAIYRKKLVAQGVIRRGPTD